MKIFVAFFLLIGACHWASAACDHQALVTDNSPFAIPDVCAGCPSDRNEADATTSSRNTGEEEGFEDDTPKESLQYPVVGLFLSGQKIRHTYQMVFNERSFDNPTPPPRENIPWHLAPSPVSAS